MSESSNEEKKPLPWWAIDKEAWRKKFSPILTMKTEVNKDDKFLPRWTTKDIEAFAKEDPVHGPQMLAMRKASTACNYGAVVGALGSAGVALRYSKSPPGAVLAGILGTVAGFIFTDEGASWAYGLYKFDPWAANLEFLEWWRKRSSS